MSFRYFYHTNDKDAVLAHSHYSDPAFDGHGAVIFGKEVRGSDGAYPDRLSQWDREKWDAAHDAAKLACPNTRTARYIECFLREYYNDPELELLSIRSGTQQFNGYPWFWYGFNRGAK